MLEIATGVPARVRAAVLESFDFLPFAFHSNPEINIG
jgi:hypothetical protein